MMIMNGAATPYYSPRILEFDNQILEPLLKRHYKRNPMDFSEKEQHLSIAQGTLIITNYLIIYNIPIMNLMMIH